MEFVRRIYGLSAEGDKTVRYIGQTENISRRFIQHVNFHDPCITCKVIWLARCRMNDVRVRVRTLEVVTSDSEIECKQLAFRREFDWINRATDRGIRLVNGKMWYAGAAPKGVCLSWEYFQRRIVREFFKRLRDKEEPEFGFMWEERGIVREIEEQFPELNVMKYRYKRIWQAPACM